MVRKLFLLITAVLLLLIPCCLESFAEASPEPYGQDHPKRDKDREEDSRAGGEGDTARS
jgi:hypothetical protein